MLGFATLTANLQSHDRIVGFRIACSSSRVFDALRLFSFTFKSQPGFSIKFLTTSRCA